MTDIDVQVDRGAVDEFAQRMLAFMTGACTVLMTHLGDRLGLYKDLAGSGAATPEELAARTGCNGRYLAEWSAQQAAVGILTYDAASGRFTLPAEHAFVLAFDDSPAALAGGVENVVALSADLDAVGAAFHSGAGIGASMTGGSTPGWPGSSGRPTEHRSSASGCRPWGWIPCCARAPAWPTWGAARV